MSKTRTALSALICIALFAGPADAAVTLTSPADGDRLLWSPAQGTTDVTFTTSAPDDTGTADIVCSYTKGGEQTIVLAADVPIAGGEQTVAASLADSRVTRCDLEVRRDGGASSQRSRVLVDRSGSLTKTRVGNAGAAAMGSLADGLVQTWPNDTDAAAQGFDLFANAGRVTAPLVDGSPASLVGTTITMDGATTTVQTDLQVGGEDLVRLTRTYDVEAGGSVVVVRDNFISLDDGQHGLSLPYVLRGANTAPDPLPWSFFGGGFATRTGGDSVPAPGTVPALVELRRAGGVFPNPTGAIVLAGKSTGAIPFADHRSATSTVTRLTPATVTHAFVTGPTPSGLVNRFKPALTLNGPSSTSSSSAVVSGVVTAGGNGLAGSVVTVRGVTANPDPVSGAYTALVPLATGANTITATVTDPGGAVATATRSITRTVPPPGPGTAPPPSPSSPPSATPPAPQPPAPQPPVAGPPLVPSPLASNLSFGTVTFNGKALRVGLHCRGGDTPCTGTVAVTATERVKKRSGKSVTRKYTVGSSSFVVPKARSRSVNVTLPKKSLAALRKARRLAVSIVATVDDPVVAGSRTVTRTYTARPPTRGGSRRRR